MASRKKAEGAAGANREPTPPKQNQKTVTLALDEALTARFRKLASDYGKRPREARRAAEALMAGLLDRLAEQFEAEKMETEEREIKELKDLLQTKTAALAEAQRQKKTVAEMEVVFGRNPRV